MSAGCATISVPPKSLDPPYEVSVSDSQVGTSVANEIFKKFASQSAVAYGFENCILSGDAHLAQEKSHFTSTNAFGIPFIVLPTVSILAFVFFGVLRYRKGRLRSATASKKSRKSSPESSGLKASSSSEEMMYVDRKGELEEQRKYELEAVNRLYELDGDVTKYELCSTPDCGPTKVSLAHINELRGADFCGELSDVL